MPETDLPIRGVLPELLAVLERHGSAVLTAPPGTGKTTVVPPALAEAGLRVLVAEPRRLAVRAAARRMGVSYTIRGERHKGANPMVEVVTTGVLLQRLQRDQELTGVDAVILDECHERHLDADTALAFLLDVRDTLRPDLRLLATSATADAEPWARLIGGPVVAATGATHPVETIWAPPPRPVAPPHGLRVDPALLTHVASVVRRALAERDGDVLCFLPGVAEIARVAGQLAGDVDQVLQVHGQAPAHVQDAVLTPGAGRRVVLATSVAESSLTVPGVRVVVDSGLAREPRTDHSRGLGSLTTVRASKAAATQRAGRAGREAPRHGLPLLDGGRPRPPGRPPPRPEIALADLTAFTLQAACWGAPRRQGPRPPGPAPARGPHRRHRDPHHARRPRTRQSGPASDRAGAADGPGRRPPTPGPRPPRPRPGSRRGGRPALGTTPPRRVGRPGARLAHHPPRQHPLRHPLEAGNPPPPPLLHPFREEVRG
ncbi:helicase-related protein [Nonomuraea salmonea]|uniref:helicase-related protein n=1 Tax=Nonomuraea salmonea TaxID=46181 RepID=UPI002FE73713